MAQKLVNSVLSFDERKQCPGDFWSIGWNELRLHRAEAILVWEQLEEHRPEF